MSQWKFSGDVGSGWEVTPFDEERDLDDTAALYEKCNRERSGFHCA